MTIVTGTMNNIEDSHQEKLPVIRGLESSKQLWRGITYDLPYKRCKSNNYENSNGVVHSFKKNKPLCYHCI